MLEIVGEADAETARLPYMDVDDPWVLDDARPAHARRRRVAVAAADDGGRQAFETIDDLDRVQVAAVEDALAAGERLVGDVGQVGPGFGNVGVANQPEADQPSSSSAA